MFYVFITDLKWKFIDIFRFIGNCPADEYNEITHAILGLNTSSTSSSLTPSTNPSLEYMNTYYTDDTDNNMVYLSYPQLVYSYSYVLN